VYGRPLQVGYRLDLLVAGRRVVEVKSVDGLAPVTSAQVLTYLRFSSAARLPDQLQHGPL
jgi:GxxExxY protein